MRRIVKVCGMRYPANIRAVEALGIDMMGFIFHPKSSRYVETPPRYLPAHISRVGVFVDAPAGAILERAASFSLQYVQLHGNESPELCLQMRSSGLKVIKAFNVNSPSDFDVTSGYEGLCDLMLFDTRSVRGVPGGSGEQFNWDLLDCYHGKTPFLLSGGIDPASAARVSALRHPLLAGYDLNSRFETSPAMKDVEAINLFLRQLEEYEQNRQTF